MKTHKEVMQTLKANIEEFGLPHKEIYKRMGIQKTQYFSFLSEVSSRGPTLKTLCKIADAIGCSVGDLVKNI